MCKRSSGMLAVVWCTMGALSLGPQRAVAASESVARSDSWREKSGYIAASVAVTEGDDAFTLVVVDAIKREYPIAFARKNGVGPQIVMIEVPPGDYRIAAWTVAGRDARKPIPRHDPLGQPFAVRPGHVVLLGRFEATTSHAKEPIYFNSTYTRTWVIWRINKHDLPADDAWTQLTQSHDKFVEAPVECLLCTPADAKHTAAPALPQSGQFSRKHDVKIHLHRASGEYGETRLAAWEKLGRLGKREVEGATRESAMFWQREDAFGVRWNLSALNFQNGEVHFLLLDGERTLRGGKDLSWSLADGREVWIIEGDKKLYLSREDALAALPDEEAEAVRAEDPKPSTGPEVIIHFHQAVGEYDDLRLRVWTEREGAARTYVAGTSFARGVKQPYSPGAFGAIWILKETDFENGKVGFSIEGPKSQREWTFSLGDAHEVWVNADDPKVYFGLEEAEDAQEE